MVWGIFFVGCMFAVLGGLCAFVITFDEMKHHFPTGNRAAREALWRAVVVTVLLAAFCAVLGVVMARVSTTG